jgi:hypothetical protein
MTVKTKTNLILDIAIFIAFLVAANPRLTGNSIHEWLSLSFAAAIVSHLLFHWKWLVKVTTTYFKNFFHQSRLNYVVALLFFVSMTVVIFSGLMISKDILSLLGIQLDVSRSWKSIHSLSADASTILLAIHFSLHWKWIVNSIKLYVTSPILGMFRAPEPQPLPVRSLQVSQEK